MNSQTKSVLLALSATLIWSTVGTAFKLTLSYTGVIPLLLYASFTSLLIFTIVLWCSRKFPLLCENSWQQWVYSALVGFLNPFLYYLVLLKAYDLLLAQEAGTLNYLWPVVLSLLSVPFLGHRLSWKGFLAILVSFSGTIIIGTRGQLTTLKFENPLGVVLALSSALIWAIFWILNVRDSRDQVVKLFYGFLFGSIYVLIFATTTVGLIRIEFPAIVGSVYIGLFEMGITYILWLRALQMTTSAARISNLVYLSPFISLIIIHLVLGETIYLSTFIGLILIVGGILLQQVIARYEQKAMQVLKK